jgi:drug/metabolite transporter (DMT)-like permease
MKNRTRAPSTRLGTLSGLGAILIWGTNVALSRSLTESLGPVTAGTCVYGLAAVVCAVWLLFRPRDRGTLRRLPRRYLFGCGGLFALYIACFYLALGLAAGRQQAIEVSLINYLWPSLTLVFAVPLLKMRARPGLIVGLGVAMAGVALALTGSGPFSWGAFAGDLRENGLPCALALVCAVTWALYSSLSRRWAGHAESGALPVFIIMTGVAMLAARCLVVEESRWSATVVAELAYAGLLPGLAGYVLWDTAVRKGEIVVVASASYAIPLLSTGMSQVYLKVPLGPSIWLACGLVVAGAVVCKLSVADRPG